MHVFITGATGWMGSVLVKELIESSHRVVGLVRSEEQSRVLSALGGEPLMGSLSDVESLKEGAHDADAIIHTAFGRGIGQSAAFIEAARADCQAIEIFGNVFAGTDRPILVTAGIGVLPQGQMFTEGMPPAPINPAFPRASEQAAAALAERGVHAATVRLPRSVHGAGETHGFVPQLMTLARHKGVSGYVGDGNNLWPSVHRLDAARVYRLALERGGHGGPFHAVAEEGIPFRQIAEAIGRRLGLSAKPIAFDEAAEHFGTLVMPVRGNGPVSSLRTRERLAWEPRQLDLIADIDQNY